MITPEQAAAMGMKREDDATWAGTPEHEERERREKQRALERHRERFGTTPA